MLFEIYFPCLTSSRYLCPHLGAAVGFVAFDNAWDYRAAPWMAQATIKLFKLEWSAAGRFLSQGRLTICTLWNWSLTKYLVEEEQQSSGLECMEASTCKWGPVFQMLCFAAGCTSRTVTYKWSQSRHFVWIVLGFAWRVFWFVGGFLFVCGFCVLVFCSFWVLFVYLLICFLFWLNRFTRIYLCGVFLPL